MLTGSAGLDIYRRGGDSLQGRYHYYRLHPFSVSEMEQKKPELKPFKKLAFGEKKISHFDTLFAFGGFPAPLIRQDSRHLRRWHTERLERFFREDIRDLTAVQDIGNLSLLADLLQERSASLLSINSLAGDLQVNFRTVSNWLNIFERLYFCFRLSPFQARTIASVRKEKKLYLWDWSQILEEGNRLENVVASHLLKFCHYLTDHDGWKAELFYLRDNTGREVDFLVCINRKPWFAVEVKTGRDPISRHLKYFQEKLKIPFCYQVQKRGENEYLKEDIHILPVSKFLTALV